MKALPDREDGVFRRCLYCHQSFPGNDTVERFAFGRRIAFDPWRGRLWVVCGSCSRWTLAPIEERWEVLEDLNRLVRDHGRTLSTTDNIALIRAGDIELVRVGRAELAEEAWWRYGRELRNRRTRARKAGIAETVLWIGAMGSGFGMLVFLGDGDGTINNVRRWYRYGSHAWIGDEACRRCGDTLTRIPFRKAQHLIVAPDEDGGVVLELRCTRCGVKREDAGYRITGVTGEHVLRRVMAYRHFTGASDRRVLAATGCIEEAGSADALMARVTAKRTTLRHIDHKSNRTEAVALEIALNDDVERRMLELELKELESRWREEEELASIIDGELTASPLLGRLRARIAQL